MNWKKAIAFLLLLGLMPGLVGCGGENAPQTDESMETKAAEATAPTVLKLEPELEPGTEPTPEPTMEPPVPEIIDESWFDDAIFVGDSITGMLSSYTLLNGGLGDALVVYANSYSCHNAVEDGVKLSYQGEKLSMAELVERTGAGKAFFLLAMNDLSRTPEQVTDCWAVVLEDIRSRCRVEARGGLVRQHNAWLCHDGARDCHALLLPAGKLAGLVRQPAAQADCLQRLHSAAQTHSVRQPLQGQRQGHVFQRRHARQKLKPLEHKPDPLAAQARKRLRRQAGNIRPIEQIGAFGQRVKQAEYVHERGLARAGCARDGHIIPAAHGQVDAAQRAYTAFMIYFTRMDEL